VIDIIFMAVGAAICILGIFLTNREITRNRTVAAAAVVRAEQTARTWVKTIRDAARASLHAKREIRRADQEIKELELVIEETRRRLTDPEVRIAWTMVIAERRGMTTDVPWAVEVKDEQNGVTQWVLLWDSDRSTAIQRVVRRYPAASEFSVGSAISYRNPPKSA
jgi:hypothetical protein